MTCQIQLPYYELHLPSDVHLDVAERLNIPVELIKQYALELEPRKINIWDGLMAFLWNYHPATFQLIYSYLQWAPGFQWFHRCSSISKQEYFNQLMELSVGKEDGFSFLGDPGIQYEFKCSIAKTPLALHFDKWSVRVFAPDSIIRCGPPFLPWQYAQEQATHCFLSISFTDGSSIRNLPATIWVYIADRIRKNHPKPKMIF